MVGQRVGAAVFAVHQEVHHLVPGRPLKAHPAGDFPRHGVAHQRLVAQAVDEHPLLGLHGRLVDAVLHHVVALAVVELDAVGLVLGRCGVVAPHAEQDGVVLQQLAVVVDELRARLEVLTSVLGQDVVLHMDAQRGDVGHLVELAVVALALVAVELQHGDVAARVCRPHVAHVAEAARNVDVGIVQGVHLRLLADEVERHGVHEVGAVGTLEDTQQHLVGAAVARLRTETDARDDVWLAAVEPRPCHALVPCREEGLRLAVESVGEGVGRGCLTARNGVVAVFRADGGAVDECAFCRIVSPC